MSKRIFTKIYLTKTDCWPKNFAKKIISPEKICLQKKCFGKKNLSKKRYRKKKVCKKIFAKKNILQKKIHRKKKFKRKKKILSTFLYNTEFCRHFFSMREIFAKKKFGWKQIFRKYSSKKRIIDKKIIQGVSDLMESAEHKIE